MTAPDQPHRSLLHGTAIALRGCAALIRGASGSGKSDVALRCLAHPIRYHTGTLAADLVGDDQLVAERTGADIWLSAPETIRDRIEIRGLGIRPWPTLARARLVVVIDLVAPQLVERMPDPESVEILGVSLPKVRLTPFEASAPTKLLLLLDSLAGPSLSVHDNP